MQSQKLQNIVVFCYNYDIVFMKAQLILRKKKTLPLKFGGSVTIFMDCYQINKVELGFDAAYRFSLIAYDPLRPERRVLIDQHVDKPCHLHIEDREFEIESPATLDALIELFQLEVVKYFGEAEEA